MEHPGLLSWANSVRITMAGDPGRQLFKDQVQTHGFLFLDDYLDNIVSGAKQDPLIELVKTPGRKKAIAKKPTLMSSKLGSIISSSSEDDDGSENAVPTNSLQKALFTAKANKSNNHDTIKFEKSKRDLAGDSGDKPQRAALLPIHPSNDAVVIPMQHVVVLVQQLEEQQPSLEPILHTNTEHNDLSIIAEDEEPSERRRSSTSGRMEFACQSPPVSKFPEASNAPDRLSTPHHARNASQHEINTISSSSMDSFHSIPLNSPIGSKAYNAIPHVLDKPETPVVDDEASPLPSHPSNDLQDHVMAGILQGTVQANQKPNDKLPAPSFPTLPDPMPLRKPARDHSMNAVMLGATTPGAPTGKRTSWLMKAREVKALEGTSKKNPFPSINSIFGSTLSLPQGTKRKSGDMFSTTHSGLEEEERQQKVSKTAEGESAPRKSKDIEFANVQEQPTTKPQIEEWAAEPQEGVLDLLKKTVEGLGVRIGKTMGKSLGGGAATALAEARAAAEARVAERDRKEEEMTMAMGRPAATVNHSGPSQDTNVMMASTRPNEGRLSVSDLFPMEGRIKEKHKAPEKVFQFTPNPAPVPIYKTKEAEATRMSTSTTPPNSPPPAQTNIFTRGSSPVFKPPVFVPPVPVASASKPTPPGKDFAAPKYNVPTSMTLDFSPQGKAPTPLTTHSTLESVQSDSIFDRDDVPVWMPSTQDTEYTSGFGSQSQQQGTQICDEDDSWPVDEKMAAGVQWAYGASKEDSMTWSTLPSQSQRADTGPATKTSPIREERIIRESIQGDEELVPRDEELEEIVRSSSKANVSIAEPKIPRSQSQMSMASSGSSQSQVGLLGQASKLLSSAMGTGKKKQPEVKKVLQMAAVAAKKQQEEADKKAARLKEMESRRQLALQRKAEEEKAKAMDEERKMKEESDRRKRERDEHTDKRPLKLAASKKEDESQKKRKIETEKKLEMKKPAPSVILGKSHLKSALKHPAAPNPSLAYSSSTQSFASTSTAVHEAAKSMSESSTSLYKGKSQMAQKSVVDDDVSQPSQLVQSQMAARAKAQLEAAKPTIPSESIELPDINSEYSDSEDEDRVRTFDPPEWAQSPELRQALQMQSTINPDDIFGAVRPLRMEEIFKTRTSRFRARTSSANWTGTDRLTIQEELEYARRMGFK